MSTERGPPEEQNDANFSSVALSSEELWVCKEIDQNTLLRIVHGFRPNIDKFDFGKTGYHRKGYRKRNITEETLTLI